MGLKNHPIHLLKSIDVLSPNKLEQSFLDDFNNKRLFNYQYQWNSKHKKNGILIDLSNVQWVNLSAAHQLILFIEYAKKSSIKVYIALPCLNQVNNYSKADNKVDIVYKRRKKATDFLKFIQFIKVARCEHIDGEEVIISNRYIGSDNTDRALQNFNNAFNDPSIQKFLSDEEIHRYKHILPLTWIDCNKSKELSKIHRHLAGILKNSAKGLGNLDILSLKNVILHELVKNVREHAGTQTRHALLSIGIIDASALYSVKSTSSLSSYNLENDFIDYIKNNNLETTIEIHFGDSGNGLLNQPFISAFNKEFKKTGSPISKRDKLEVLKWSFDKWSTRKTDEKKRGTKGLYRINRINNKYNGIFHIRTSEIHGGFQKGGFISPKWVNNLGTNLYPVKGSIINLRLWPFEEVTKFNFTFKRGDQNKNWISLKYELNEANSDDFGSWASAKIKTDANVLLIIQPDKEIKLKVIQDFLESNLKTLSYLRHPNGIVVYISHELGSNTLDQIIDSTNELIKKNISADERIPESYEPFSEDIYDPVLVLDKNRVVHWYGGNPTILKLLNSVYENKSFNKSIEDLDIYKSLSKIEKQNIKLHFHNDASLIVLSNDNKLEFNFTDIPSIFRSQIREITNQPIAKKQDHSTPKLSLIKKWHSVEEILKKNEIGYALTLYFNVLNYFKENEIDFHPNDKTYILIDHNQQKNLAQEFARIIGINEHNIISETDDVDDSIPRRTTLFKPNSQVFIITSFISSSETSIRLTKYIKRDISDPILILCLVNSLESNVLELKNWDTEVPIAPIYKNNPTKENPVDFFNSGLEAIKQHINKLESAVYFINPDHRICKKVKEEFLIENIKLPNDLRNHFIETKCLHYNHLGRFNGRHFTFYIDRYKLFNSKSIIWMNISDRIKKWVKKRNISKVNLYIGKFYYEASYLNQCIKFLKEEIKELDQIIYWSGNYHIFTKEEDLVYLDFGSLSGKTVNNFISQLRDCKSLLMCIVFSQLNKGNKAFYKRIKDVEIPHFQSNQTSNLKIPIEIIHLYELPLDYYSSSNCPICEQIHLLERNTINNKYLSDFANDRINRLRIKERRSVLDLEYPADFYKEIDDNDYELSSVLIMNMFELKLLLKVAQFDTQYRLLILKYLFEICSHIDAEISDPNSNLYSILYFLAHEINWLQKEPLVFRIFRNLLTIIGFEIATMPLEDLADRLQTDDLNTNALKLAVRYKFCAITLLRSANKNRFCESIEDIFESCIVKDKLSNNLFQNLLFHIHTIHSNKYNRKIELFNLIDKSLSMIYDSKILTSIQKLSISKLKINNDKITISIIDFNVDNNSDIELIKYLKHGYVNLYNTVSHPTHYESFLALDFRNLDGYALPDLEKNGSDSIYYDIFKSQSEELVDSWNYVNQTIEPKVLPYLYKLSDDFKSSELFSSYNIETRVRKVFSDEWGHSFSNFIIDFENNIDSIPKNYNQYHDLYDRIFNTIISYKRIGDINSRDSNLLSFLNNFPTSIYKVITDTFHDKSVFDVTLNLDEKIDSVFYPEYTMKIYLKHIIKNIKKYRILPDDVKIPIEFRSTIFESNNKQYCNLSILNFGTISKEYNYSGGLSQFKEDLIKMGGDLSFRSGEKTDFIIQILFQLYEKY